MHTTHAPKKNTKGCTLFIPPPKIGNFLSVHQQIALKAMSKKHNKSRSRAKNKRAWKKGD
jgi:hypothetical protein